MAYRIQITAPVSRAATIRAKLDANRTPPREFYAFRNRRHELPVIQVSLELPVYRMENFRTFTGQREYLDKEGKTADFFARGQESETAQQAQHELLVKLAETGREGSIVPVKTVLEKEGQREPLLITASGVVVNGNRRLAAMRELFAHSPTEFANFSHIDVMVLPADATEDEILDVEANLQAMPETKLDYDWIGEAQLIKRLVSLGRTHKQVADQLHLKPNDIKSAIQRLAEADLFLKEVGGPSSFIDIRDNAEQFFKDLTKAIEDKSERAREESRVVAYALYLNKERLPGRLYNFNAAFGKLTDDVLERTSIALGVDSEDPDRPSVSEDVDDVEFSLDDLDLDVGDTDGERRFQGAIDALRSPDNAEAIDVLIDAAQTAIELEAGDKRGREAIKTIGQAHSKLASVDLNRAAVETLPGIKKQLDAINKRVGELEEVLNRRLQP